MRLNLLKKVCSRYPNY